MFAINDKGVLRQLTELKIIGPQGQQASRQILTVWTPAELKAWNIYPLTEDPVPAGKREVSRSFVRTGDTVNITKVLENIPGAVAHAIGTNGVVTSTTIMVPSVEGPSADVFPSSLAVGQTYDAKDFRYDKLDLVTHKILFQLINDVRALKIPAQAAITPTQYKAFVKSQMT